MSTQSADRVGADRRADTENLRTRGLPRLFWAVSVSLAAAAVIATMVSWSEAKTLYLLLLLAFPIGLLARSLGERHGRRLSELVMLGWIAKMVASAARYWALQVLYLGVGDATGYHGDGRRLAPVWRSLHVPAFETGTEFVEALTGLIYVPHEPTKLGGFFIFATLAFLGQVMLFAAFTRAFPTIRSKWYAILIFFFPNILYWPASIGKDSLMVLFIGTSAYGAVRLLIDYRLRWLLVFGAGLSGCAVIRSHIALLLVGSLAVALLLGRTTRKIGGKRVLALVVVGFVVVFIGRITSQDFGIDPATKINEAILEDVIDPIFTGVEGQTDKGGSAVSGHAIRSPADVPAALLRVVFRPLPNDANNAQSLANSLVEGTLLLLLFVMRGPAIIRNFVARWRSPYVLFSLVYTAGFVFGHSAILNLGIMARQRSQVIPFVLVLLVGLSDRGWAQRNHENGDSTFDVPSPRDRLRAPIEAGTPERNFQPSAVD